MRFFSYVVARDYGFTPNPSYGTLIFCGFTVFDQTSEVVSQHLFASQIS